VHVGDDINIYNVDPLTTTAVVTVLFLDNLIISIISIPNKFGDVQAFYEIPDLVVICARKSFFLAFHFNLVHEHRNISHHNLIIDIHFGPYFWVILNMLWFLRC
jgi:hypothetical protein